VIWLVGPPGAGKTTLVASWLKAQRVKNLWIQLDQGDGDVASFFHYLAMAASTLKGKPTLPPLSSESLSSMATFSRRFFRALFSMRHPPEVLVLDDYQEVPAAAPLHGALRDGLGELPEEATVVVLSHAEPPQEMARWLARGKLEVVRNPELALTATRGAVTTAWRRCTPAPKGGQLGWCSSWPAVEVRARRPKVATSACSITSPRRSSAAPSPRRSGCCSRRPFSLGSKERRRRG
jgi:hypothetical protein